MKAETEELLEVIERLTRLSVEPLPVAMPGQYAACRSGVIQATADALCRELQSRLAPSSNPYNLAMPG